MCCAKDLEGNRLDPDQILWLERTWRMIARKRRIEEQLRLDEFRESLCGGGFSTIMAAMKKADEEGAKDGEQRMQR